MRTELLDYVLPEQQIARRPLSERDAARLLVLGRHEPTHASVADWVRLVPEGALGEDFSELRGVLQFGDDTGE